MTYSIVARDPVSGELGVGVQSHWFAVGAVVSWARAGVGAVATQSIAEEAYGPRLLERISAGEPPDGALEQLLESDGSARFRQVAAVDAHGRVAVHTGDGCIRFAGHVEGEGFSAQANMMASPEVWPAMAAAFGTAEGSLADRLLDALDAGEASGGDVRGRQSAALLVVSAEGEPWATVTDVRVDDHPEPLVELRRLARLDRAYALASEGDDLIGEGRPDEAGERYRAAVELAPESHELIFWSGMALVQAGERERGLERIRGAIAAQPGWADLLPRLPPELAPEAGAVLRALGLDR